jgi:hypothetical protein
MSSNTNRWTPDCIPESHKIMCRPQDMDSLLLLCCQAQFLKRLSLQQGMLRSVLQDTKVHAEGSPSVVGVKAAYEGGSTVNQNLAESGTSHCCIAAGFVTLISQSATPACQPYTSCAMQAGTPTAFAYDTDSKMSGTCYAMK